jgi:hypothetical protein
MAIHWDAKAPNLFTVNHALCVPNDPIPVGRPFFRKNGD